MLVGDRNHTEDQAEQIEETMGASQSASQSRQHSTRDRKRVREVEGLFDDDGEDGAEKPAKKSYKKNFARATYHKKHHTDLNSTITQIKDLVSSCTSTLLNRHEAVAAERNDHPSTVHTLQTLLREARRDAEIQRERADELQAKVDATVTECEKEHAVWKCELEVIKNMLEESDVIVKKEQGLDDTEIHDTALAGHALNEMPDVSEEHDCDHEASDAKSKESIVLHFDDDGAEE
ncbi:hypothetical protein HKX48_003908 [Thoreauomyces humboldtii]|nr:hypothetical protein HKX48_003908 [Thoreauomyces humboldtii]